MPEIGAVESGLFRNLGEAESIEPRTVKQKPLKMDKDEFVHVDNRKSLQTELDLKTEHLSPLLEKLNSIKWSPFKFTERAALKKQIESVDSAVSVAAKIIQLPSAENLDKGKLVIDLANIHEQNRAGFEKIEAIRARKAYEQTEAGQQAIAEAKTKAKALGVRFELRFFQ